MKDLKFARKLMLFCGAIGMLLLVISGAAVWQMSAMNAVSEEINTDHVPQALEADKINTAASAFEAAIGLHIVAADPAVERAAEARRRASQDIIAKSTAAILRTDLDPTEKALLSDFDSNWKRFVDASNRVMDLSRLGRDDDAGEALSRARPLFDAASTDLSKFSVYQQRHIAQATQDARNAYDEGKYGALMLVVLAAVALAFAYSLLNRLIAAPLAAMTTALGELASGRRDVTVPVEPRADEVGDLARAMTALRDQLAAADRAKQEQATLLVDSVGHALRELAEGNLATRVTAELAGPFASLKSDFNHAMVELSAVVASVSEGAADFEGAAREIRAASDDLARRTEEQAAAIEETVGAMNQVTEMVAATARSAGEVDRTIGKAHAEATQGGEVVARAVAAMADIERSSSEVTQIIDVIDGIAFQTNLLALNAGVEAARAGDAGKGFAVVASEVRALAQRSAEAARNIKDLIATSGEQVGHGVRLVSETGKVLDRIVGEVGTISNLANAIATSAEAQATRVQQVNAAISEMDRMTQQNAAMVEETTAAAGSLSEKSSGLAGLVGRFRTGEGGAVTTVRRLQPAPAAIRWAPAPRVSGNLALAAGDEDWSEF